MAIQNDQSRVGRKAWSNKWKMKAKLDILLPDKIQKIYVIHAKAVK